MISRQKITQTEIKVQHQMQSKRNEKLYVIFSVIKAYLSIKLRLIILTINYFINITYVSFMRLLIVISGMSIEIKHLILASFI